MKIKVMFTDAQAHDEMPQCYPAVGTVAEVECELSDLLDDNLGPVKWPNGSTSYDDLWYVDVGCLSYQIGDEWMTFDQVKSRFGGAA